MSKSSAASSYVSDCYTKIRNTVASLYSAYAPSFLLSHAHTSRSDAHDQTLPPSSLADSDKPHEPSQSSQKASEVEPDMPWAELATAATVVGTMLWLTYQFGRSAASDAFSDPLSILTNGGPLDANYRPPAYRSSWR
jgi:hypothetical protein